MTPAQQALLEKRGRWDVGRDPRQVSRDELIAAGHKPMSPLKALRLRCLDCKAGDVAQVRRCEHLECPASPFRTGKNPWRKEPSEAQQRHTRTLAEKRRAGAENQPSGKHESRMPEVPATILPAESYPQAKPVVLGDAACQAAGSKATLREELWATGHKAMSPLKALRARCLDCCCGSANEVSLCTAVSCPAWPWRTGSSPWRSPASEAQREAGRLAAAGMALWRASAPSQLDKNTITEVPAITLPAEPSLRPDAERERAFQTQATLSVEDAR